MPDLLECVPNFSEGRRADVVEQIVAAASTVADVKILGVSSDVDHNRSVVTLAGAPQPLIEAVFRAVRSAVELIDLRVHAGRHPRLGAADVVPFVPMAGTPMDVAVAAARTLAARVGEALELPVYLYGEAALDPSRYNLEAVRRKGFEELTTGIADPDRTPDFGPLAVHPSAGAVVIGARRPLIAYNIYLNTSDVSIARAIARVVRHSSGGLRHVKALGIDMSTRGQVQVSMNLTEYRQSAMHTVFNLVKQEAESYGVSVTHSEIVGLTPLDALLDAARHYLRLHEFSRDQILDLQLLERDE